MPEQKDNVITIADKEYNLNELSDNAKALINNVRIVDREVASLEQKLAINKTARAAYISALQAELAKA